MAVTFFAFGCGSNPAGNVTGPTNEVATMSAAPAPTTLPVPEPSAATGFYGTVSNLSAAGFTLTSPDGRTYNVTVTPETQVLYQGTMTSLADSPLENGMTATVSGAVAGLPEHAPLRAFLVIINVSYTNQGLIAVD